VDGLEEELRQLTVNEPFTHFKDHGLEVIGKVRVYLERVSSSRSDSVRRSCLWLCDTVFQWLLIQFSTFKIAEASVPDRRWVALNNFTSYYATELNLAVTPLPLFGYTYFSSGSFSYYKRLALRLERDYYVLSVDKADPPLFWPLALHEFSHCWLGLKDHVDRICGVHPEEMYRIERATVEERVEEALCDTLATRIIGPAYPKSYVNKLWARFPAGVVASYPSHRFRIECMARILDDMELFKAAADLRKLGDAQFTDSWRDEEVSWAINDLLDVASRLPKLVSEIVDVDANKAVTLLGRSPPKDLPTLFLACWTLVERSGPEGVPLAISRTSDAILRVLEGRTVSSDPLA